MLLSDIAKIITEDYNTDKSDTIKCLLSNENANTDRLLLRIRFMNGDSDDDDFNLLKIIEKDIIILKLKVLIILKALLLEKLQSIS